MCRRHAFDLRQACSFGICSCELRFSSLSGWLSPKHLGGGIYGHLVFYNYRVGGGQDAADYQNDN